MTLERRLEPRPDPQRPAARQRPPLPAARRRPARRARRARARARAQPRPRDLGDLGGRRRRSSSSGRRTRSTPRSRRCGWARASASPSPTRSTTSRPCGAVSARERRRRRASRRPLHRRRAGRERRAFVDLSPIDEQPLAEVARGGRGRRSCAVAAARGGVPRLGGARAGRARAELPAPARRPDRRQRRAARRGRVPRHGDAAALAARARDRARGARNFRAYADLAVAYEERDWSSNGTANRVHAACRAGPAVVITPWNAPFMLSTWKIAPALAAGCTVVLKPAEWSPLSCSLLADLAAEAGLPAGRLQRRPGDRRGGRRGARRRIRASGASRSPARPRPGAGDRPRPRPRNLVPFTGGARRQGAAARLRRRRSRGRRAQGRRPVRRRRPGLPRRARGCSSRSRSPSEFLELFHRFTDEHVLGDPRDDATTVSPLIHREHLDAGRGLRRARARRPATRSCAAARASGARRALVRADARRAALERVRDRAARGVRAGADASRRSPTRTRRSRSPTRPRTASRRSSTRRRRSAPSGSAAPSAPAPSG